MSMTQTQYDSVRKELSDMIMKNQNTEDIARYALEILFPYSKHKDSVLLDIDRIVSDYRAESDNVIFGIISENLDFTDHIIAQIRLLKSYIYSFYSAQNLLEKEYDTIFSAILNYSDDELEMFEDIL